MSILCLSVLRGISNCLKICLWQNCLLPLKESRANCKDLLDASTVSPSTSDDMMYIWTPPCYMNTHPGHSHLVCDTQHTNEQFSNTPHPTTTQTSTWPHPRCLYAHRLPMEGVGRLSCRLGGVLTTTRCLGVMRSVSVFFVAILSHKNRTNWPKHPSNWCLMAVQDTTTIAMDLPPSSGCLVSVLMSQCLIMLIFLEFCEHEKASVHRH